MSENPLSESRKPVRLEGLFTVHGNYVVFSESGETVQLDGHFTYDELLEISLDTRLKATRRSPPKE